MAHIRNDERWKAEARKVGGESLVDVINEILAGQRDIISRLDRMDRAFPGGDAEGHMRYHEMIQRKAEEFRRLRVAVSEKTISGLIWMMVVGTGLLLWKAVVAAVMSSSR